MGGGGGAGTAHAMTCCAKDSSTVGQSLHHCVLQPGLLCKHAVQGTDAQALRPHLQVREKRDVGSSPKLHTPLQELA